MFDEVQKDGTSNNQGDFCIFHDQEGEAASPIRDTGEISMRLSTLWETVRGYKVLIETFYHAAIENPDCNVKNYPEQLAAPYKVMLDAITATEKELDAITDLF